MLRGRAPDDGRYGADFDLFCIDHIFLLFSPFLSACAGRHGGMDEWWLFDRWLALFSIIYCLQPQAIDER